MRATWRVELSKEWKETIDLLSSAEFKARLAREMLDALRINLRLLERAIVYSIREAKSLGRKNRWLTEAIKGSTGPLRQTAQMMNSVSSQIVRWNKAYVGVLAKRKSRKLVMYARVAHWGMDIRVTRKMRAMFYVLHLATLGRIKAGQIRSRRARKLLAAFRRNARGQVWPLLKKSHIKIPARPFLLWALNRPEIYTVAENFAVGVIRALTAPSSRATYHFRTV